MTVKEIIESSKNLSASEKAFIAQCLISSLETRHDDNVEQAWRDLSQKRYEELIGGKVEPVSWGEMKQRIKR